MDALAMLIYGVLRSGQPLDVDFEKKKACVSRRYLTLALLDNGSLDNWLAAVHNERSSIFEAQARGVMFFRRR
jgi:hypothetical protein